MRRNEIWNELLTQALLTVYLVKDTLELLKKLERRLSHQFQYSIRSMLWSYLQSTTHMIADKFTGIFPCRLVSLLILTVMKQKVISHTRAYETLLHLWQGINRTVDVEQGRMVGVKVRTYLRIDTRRTLALGTSLEVSSVHSVHIGRRAAKIRKIALEIRELHYLLNFLHDTLLRTARYELSLMGRDSTEGATAKASSVHVDRELDHVVGWYSLTLVLRVRNTHIGQVKRGINLLGCHWRIRWVDHHEASVNALDKSLGMNLVALFLYMPKVISLCPLVTKTFLVAMQHYIIIGNATGYIFLSAKEDGLREFGDIRDLPSLIQFRSNSQNGFLAHSVGDDIACTIAKDALTKTVFPVVIMG